MPPRMDDTKRAAILDAIKAGGTCRGVAREHVVSPDTVRRIAAEGGIEQPFARTNTKNATRAKQADNKSLRTALSHRLLVKADQLLDQMERPHTVWNFGGKDNTFNSTTVDRPPISDLRSLMTAAAVAIDKHAVLERIDSDNGAEAARSMLAGLAEGLRVAYEQLPADD